MSEKIDQLHPPTRHTVLINNATTMWEKMYWDIAVFEDIQRSYPTENQPLVFSAINACISAWSLQEWTWKETSRSGRKNGDARSEKKKFIKKLNEEVLIQGMCADIANTAKHGEYGEKGWPGGAISLEWVSGSEDTPPGFMLWRSGVRAGVRGRVLLFDDFVDLPAKWWHFLKAQSLVSCDQPTPDWLRHKFARIFGSKASAQDFSG